MPSGSEDGTSVAAPDKRAISPIPPTSVTTAGSPADMASSSDTGKPSVTEDITNRSAASRNGETSACSPKNVTQSVQLELIAEFPQAGIEGPVADHP